MSFRLPRLAIGVASLAALCGSLPGPAHATCAEDLTRIELALPNVSADLRAQVEPRVKDAQEKARQRDGNGCTRETAQILRQLNLPVLAPIALSTPVANQPPAAQANMPGKPSAESRSEQAESAPPRSGKTYSANGTPSTGNGPASHASSASGEGAAGPTAGSGHPAGSTSPATPAGSENGDAAHGQALAQSQCSVCHSFQPGGAARVGPNLFGLTRRDIASEPGFDYSPALKAHQGTMWNAETLDSFLKSPGTFAPGTRMAFPGIASAADRRDVVAFLESLNGGGTTGESR
ncbi:MAG TPA: c-type cytochrome [Xanthobacteraceae bacterium]|nr:c-type cytochrome [Xanthobacteraceae bacterium]